MAVGEVAGLLLAILGIAFWIGLIVWLIVRGIKNLLHEEATHIKQRR
jgi:hypothetical protein